MYNENRSLVTDSPLLLLRAKQSIPYVRCFLVVHDDGVSEQTLTQMLHIP